MGNPPRYFCLSCQAAMDFVMDNKTTWLFKCRGCGRLALVEKGTGVVLWYQPDVVLQAIQRA
jgi:hypothetical protein